MKKIFDKSEWPLWIMICFLAFIAIFGVVDIFQTSNIANHLNDIKTIAESSNAPDDIVASDPESQEPPTSDPKPQQPFISGSTAEQHYGLVNWSEKSEDSKKQDYVINSDDPVSIAKVYLELYKAKQWGVTSTHTTCHNEYGDFTVTMWNGEIYIDGEGTGVKTEWRIFYDKLCEMYLSGEWDGTKTEIEGQTVYRDTYDGDICIFSGDISLHNQSENIDLPEDFDFDTFDFEAREYTYVPGHGTYAVINHSLRLFLRGESTVLPGGALDLHWDEDYERLIIYFESTDTLYIVERDFKNDTKYVYSVPDLNSSRVEFIGLFPLDL